MAIDVHAATDEREALVQIIVKSRYGGGIPPAWIVRQAQETADQILSAGFHAAA